jgi:O-antigen/teichoic acid export membrane protein
VAAVNGFLLAILSLWGWALSGTGHVARITPAAVVAAVLNLAVSIIGTHLFGLVGPLAGTAVAFVSVNLWYLPWLLRRLFGTSLRELFRAAALPPCLGVPYGVCLWWCAHAHAPHGWLGLAAEMGAAAAVYLVLAWALVLRRDDREQWINRVRLILHSSFPRPVVPVAAAAPK